MPEGNGSGFTGFQIQRWDPTAGDDGDGAWSTSIDIPATVASPPEPPPTVYTDRGNDVNNNGDVTDSRRYAACGRDDLLLPNPGERR